MYDWDEENTDDNQTTKLSSHIVTKMLVFLPYNKGMLDDRPYSNQKAYRMQENH